MRVVTARDDDATLHDGVVVGGGGGVWRAAQRGDADAARDVRARPSASDAEGVVLRFKR